MNENFARTRYQKLEEEMKPYRQIMGKAADSILDQDVSSYPIFVLHQHEVGLGIPIIRKAEEGPEWSINVTTLEELAAKKVVEMSRVDNFRTVYKDPRQNLCLLVLSDLGVNFIFIPR